MKNLFSRKNKSFDTINKTIEQINILKQSIETIIVTLSNEQNYEEVTNNNKGKFIEGLGIINQSWDATRRHINTLRESRNIRFTFTNEMNKIQNPVNYDKPEILFSHYSHINEILSRAITELEEYKRKKISENNN